MAPQHARVLGWVGGSFRLKVNKCILSFELTMSVYYFRNWETALAESGLDGPTREWYKITILWYLGFLRKEGLVATLESARAFLDEGVARKRPKPYLAQRWKDALNWFFRHAPTKRHPALSGRTSPGLVPVTKTRRLETPKERGSDSVQPARSREERDTCSDGRRRYPMTVRDYQESVGPEPLIEDAVKLMRIRQMSYRTEESYIGWLRRWKRYMGAKSMAEFGESDLKAFLSYLAVEEGVSAATQRQALNAGVFFLREVCKQELGDFSDFVAANPTKYYPVVYSRGEVAALLRRLEGKWSLMARLHYGCGLRISELCRLRVKDVDVERKKLFIRAGKGNKDRVVPLPRSLVADLQTHLAGIRTVYERDRKEDRPGVYLPGRLGKKYPNAGKQWEWFWVFPAATLSRDPRDPGLGRRRHHVLTGQYQRQLTRAAQAAGIPKRSNSHILRHSYATHLLEDGINVRTVQDYHGHACIETTMIYLHVMEDQSETGVSPLDRLG